MTKSNKVVSKKVAAPVEVASVVASAPVVVPVPAVAPAEAPVKPVKAKKEKVAESAETKWARRLGRWQAKAAAAGCDAKALMTAAIAG